MGNDYSVTVYFCNNGVDILCCRDGHGNGADIFRLRGVYQWVLASGDMAENVTQLP
jgi:hypothetical protein